jgi:hypothetical protein
MHVALPFGRGVFLWGEPIDIEPDLDEAGVERARQLVEARMLDMAALADSQVGRGQVSVAATAIEVAPELAAGKRR